MGDSLIDVEPSRARRLADAAWEHRADAARAQREAELARRVALRARDAAAAAIADRTAAVALLELGSSQLAVRRARRAVAQAAASGDDEVLAGALVTLGGTLLVCGQRSESLAVLDQACNLAHGPSLIDARAQRAMVLNSLGRRTEALVELTSLLDPTATNRPDTVQRAELLHDQAVVFAFLARFAEAESAFVAAAALFDDLDQPAASFDARRNLALSYVQAGRLPVALRLFDELERISSGDVQQLVWLGCVQMEALIAANLRGEAAEVASRLVETAAAASADLRAEAWRLCAQALAMNGDHVGAAAIARRAEPLFRRQGFVPFAAVTRRMWAAGQPPKRRVEILGEVIDELSAAGLQAETVTTRVDRLKAALDAGLTEVAAFEQAELAKVRRSGGTAFVRLQTWLGEACALDRQGESARAGRAARSGLRLLDEHRASLGATELRAHASGIGEELAAIGMTAALATGRPGEVFAAAERWRAGTLVSPPATSPELAEALAELRALVAQRDEVLGGESDSAQIERRRQHVEQRVRHLARGIDGDRASAAVVPTQKALRGVLGERALVEVIEHAGRYLAVVYEPARQGRLVTLAAVNDVRQVAGDLGFALRRLARRGLSDSAAAAAIGGATDALSQLDELLISPLGLRSSSVVIIPPASLHTVPFPALGSLARCDVTVAPSATWWSATARHAAASPPKAGGRTVLIAGPRLEGADHEVAALARRSPGAHVFTGKAASSAAVMEALDGCDLAHLACHGHLRADHPHLSALELADGPFTIYDFERLITPPRRVVLASCDSAVGAERPGDEILGFLAALLGLGTHDVLASVVPVPDLATADYMVRFHQALDEGGSFSSSLRTARAAIDCAVPANFAASVAFVAFGIAGPSA